MSSNNNFPAEFRVHWPGQTVFACVKHKDGLLAVNRAMGGMPIKIDSYDIEGEQCSNCVNENRR